MNRLEIARLEANEPERLEQRAAFYSKQSIEASPAQKIGFVLMACEARRYAANLRAMRAARMRTQMI